MTLEDRIVHFIATWGPGRLPVAPAARWSREAFIAELRELLEEYARAALVHGNLPDTEHGHGGLKET